MRPKNKTTQLFLYIGIFLCVFGITRFDTSDLSFGMNGRAYWMFIVGAISIIHAYYRNGKEKQNDRQEKE